MPAPYNMSLMNHSTGLENFYVFANTTTESLYGSFFLLAFFVIIFISMKNFGNRAALGASSGITLIIAILGNARGIVPDVTLYIAAVSTALIGVYMYIAQ